MYPLSPPAWMEDAAELSLWLDTASEDALRRALEDADDVGDRCLVRDIETELASRFTES